MVKFKYKKDKNLPKNEKLIYINGIRTNYSVSKDGKVYSLNYNHTGKKKELKHGISNGYHFVVLVSNGKRYNRHVYRLVAEAFIPNPDKKPQVNHKYVINSDDKSDNDINNLEWTTCKENINHAWKNGLSKPKRGEKNPRASTTEEEVRYVCELIESDFGSLADITRKSGLTHSKVEKIYYKQRWTNISDEYNFSNYDPKKYHNKGERNNASTTTEKQVKKICKLLESNYGSYKEIGKKVGVSKQVVSNIYHKRTWTDISKNYDFTKYIPGGKKHEK